MGLTMKVGALSLAGVMMAGTAFAKPVQKCAKPEEVTAIQTSAIQQELMVAALTCNQITNFNAFQTGFSRELQASDVTLHNMFKRIFGARAGEDQFHAFKTRMANDSSIRSIHDNASYCHEAETVFAAALAPAKPTLAAFASSVTVQEQSPVDSCEIRVAVSLSGAGGSYILPKPKPLTDSTGAPIVTAPADSPVSTTPVMPAAPAAAPTTTPAQ
ncbi:MAG TPA: hypothetical protein VIJ85_06125 [Rhizomicrobium sp.]